MKIFSALRSRRPLRRSELISCALINQFATPGLGSLMARRWVAGSGQLFLAVAGFGLFIGWFVQKMRVFYGQMFGTDLPADAGSSLLKWGLMIFVASWVWSLVTSIQLLRQAPEENAPPTLPSRLPPKL